MSDTLREQIARIIDPTAFKGNTPNRAHAARERADAVLGSLPDDRLAEAEAKVRAVEAMLAGKPDSRGVDSGLPYFSETTTDAPVDDGLVEREPFVGSMRVMDALLAVFTDHIHLSETPDDGPGYLWCACGWRSDQAGGTEEAAGRFLRTHLANEAHAALVPVIDALLAERAGEVEAARQDTLTKFHAEVRQLAENLATESNWGGLSQTDYDEFLAAIDFAFIDLRDGAARGETRQP